MNSDLVRSILDKNSYMTLATADKEGSPWASPVWYATADYREFIWVSAPQPATLRIARSDRSSESSSSTRSNV